MKFSLAAAVVGGTTLLSFGVTALPAPAFDASASPEKAIESRDIPIWTKFKEEHYSPLIEFKGNWDERDKHEIERAFEWWKRADNSEAPAIAKREAKIPNPDSYRPAGVIDVDGESYILTSEKKNGRWSYTKEAKPWDDPAFWRKSSWGKRSDVVSDGEGLEKRCLCNVTKSLINGRGDGDSSLEKRSTQIGLPEAEKEILPRKAPPTGNIDNGGSRQGSFGSFGSGGGSFSSGGGSFSRGDSREGSFGSFESFGSEEGEEEEFEKRDSSLVGRKAPPKENGGYSPIIDYGGSRQGSFGSFGSFDSGGGSFSGGSRKGSFGSFGSEGGEEDFEEYEKRDDSVVARRALPPPRKSSYGSYGSVGGGGSFSSGGGSFSSGGGSFSSGGGSFSSGGGSFSSGGGSREGSFGSFASEGGEEEEEEEYEKRGLKPNKIPTSLPSVSSSPSELSQPSWDDFEQPFEFLDDEKRSIWDHDFQNVLDDPVGALKNATASISAVDETATEKRADAETSE